MFGYLNDDDLIDNLMHLPVYNGWSRDEVVEQFMMARKLWLESYYAHHPAKGVITNDQWIHNALHQDNATTSN